MAKKEKEKPVLHLDGKDYPMDEMTDKDKQLALEVKLYENHVADIQNKLNTNAFMRQQLVECEKIFADKHQKGVIELKKALEPEVVEAEVN
jgi:hypothetical protein